MTTVSLHEMPMPEHWHSYLTTCTDAASNDPANHRDRRRRFFSVHAPVRHAGASSIDVTNGTLVNVQVVESQQQTATPFSFVQCCLHRHHLRQDRPDRFEPKTRKRNSREADELMKPIHQAKHELLMPRRDIAQCVLRGSRGRRMHASSERTVSC